MATKKQKRAAALARRAEFEAEEREIGLKAQKLDRERRKAEEARMWEDAHQVHLKRNRFHPECEHCHKIQARQAAEKMAKAADKAKESSKVLTEEEAKAMDEESMERIKGVLQEMGALQPAKVAI